MASMLVLYAIRNVQTGKFVQYMSDDGSQYEETDCSGNFANFQTELQASTYLKEKDSVYYFEIVKMYVSMPY